MYDTKSDYALNKLDREAIVCKTAIGAYVRLTEANFPSREEFLKWKSFSDQDYYDTETSQQEDDHCLSLDERSDVPVPSAEDELLTAISLSDQAHDRAAKLKRLKNTLTEVQYRRLMLNLVDKKTTWEIAEIEGVTHQAVSDSLTWAWKKILEKFSLSPQK